MCGIVGVVHADRERPVDEARLVRMRDLMTHRGPDDAGLFISGGVGLGHRRLSIIDLAGGHQPMTNEDGSLRIVFNGEIYNFQALRRRLVERGHVFRTSSDTEVILHLYEEEGERCVRSLNGIFAFAIWDANRKSLFLARDHMGVKPLYFARAREAFVFASESKAITASGYVDPRCREQGVFEYFVFRHIAGAGTLLQDVECLLPAHTLRLQDGTVRIERYWSPTSPFDAGVPGDERRAAESLSALLDDAVRTQLVSDVPLGTFCSGGVDSSLVTALAARATAHPINTFSVGFHETGFDETEFARVVSSRYGTVHHELRLGGREFADLLPKLVWHQDGPLNFANSVQIYAISKLAKEFVTVVLTGEGADEIFCGYPRYAIPSLARAYRALPALLRRAAGGYARVAGDHRLAKVDAAARHPHARALLYNAGVVPPELVRSVVMTAEDEHLAWRQSCLEGDAGGRETAACLSLLDQHTYLVSILERQDKMSMAASIESRVPFLDHRVVEFANALPVRYKLRGLQTKAILKEVARRFLPERVVSRRKSGFGVPLRAWLADAEGLGRYVDELVADRSLDPYLRSDRVATIAAEHRSGEHDHAEFLWTAINFMIWTKSLRA